MKLQSLILIIALIASGYCATTVTQGVTEGSTQCTAFVLICEADTKESGADGAVYTWTYNDGADKTLATTSYYAIDTSSATKFSQTIIVKPGTFAAGSIKPICSIQQTTAGVNTGTAAANASGTPDITVTANNDCTSTPTVNKFQSLTGSTGSEVCKISLQITSGSDVANNKIFTIGGKSTADTAFKTGMQTLDATTSGKIYVIYAENGNDDQLVEEISGAGATTLCNLKPLVDETKTTNACQSVVFKYTEAKETNYSTYDYDLQIKDSTGNLTEGSEYDLISNVTDTDIEFYILIFEESAAAGDLTVYFQVYQYSDSNQTTLIGNTVGVQSTLTMVKDTCPLGSNWIDTDEYSDDCQYQIQLWTAVTAGQWKYYGFNTHDPKDATQVYLSPNNDLSGIWLIQGTTNPSTHEIRTKTNGNCVGASVTYADDTIDPESQHLIFKRCTQDVTVTCNYTNQQEVDESLIKIQWFATNNNDDYNWESETGKSITVKAGTFSSNTNVSVGCTVSYDNGLNIFRDSETTIKYMQGDVPCQACTPTDPNGGTETDSSSILCIFVIALLALVF